MNGRGTCVFISVGDLLLDFRLLTVPNTHEITHEKVLELSMGISRSTFVFVIGYGVTANVAASHGGLMFSVRGSLGFDSPCLNPVRPKHVFLFFLFPLV